MRNPTDVPELKHDLAALGVHSLGYRTPGADLFLGPDARGIEIALGHRTDRTCFRDDQAGTGPLAIVFNGQWPRLVAFDSTIARQRGHDNTVGQLDITDLDRIEESWHGLLLLN